MLTYMPSTSTPPAGVAPQPEPAPSPPPPRIMVVDVETTGLPGKTPDHLLHVTEVGAAVIDTTGEIHDRFVCLVNPGEGVLRAPECYDALTFAGRELEEVVTELLARGKDPAGAAALFGLWVQRVAPTIAGWTAFNVEFDAGMLARPPWGVSAGLDSIPPTPCLMHLAHQIMVPHCVNGREDNPLKWLAWKWNPETGRRGDWKWPKSEEAVEWFRGHGHEIPALAHHRALDDAIMEAHLAVALERERAGSRPVGGERD